MKTMHLKIAGRDYTIQMDRSDGSLTLQVGDDEKQEFSIRDKDGELVVKSAAGVRRVFVHRQGERVWAASCAEPYAAERFHPEHGASDNNDAAFADIVAPMNGRVVQVLVAAGSEVAEGDGIVVIEAMKMEHKLAAPFAARVDSLDCEEGQQVEMNEVLAHLIRRNEDS